MQFNFYSLLILLLWQLFGYGFARALLWQGDVRHQSQRRWIYFASFALSNILMILVMMRVSSMMFRIAAHWLVLLLFMLFTALIILVLSFLLKKLMNDTRKRQVLRWLAPLVLIGIYTLAIYQAYTPVVQHVRIQIDKPLQKTLRIGLASDLHLGQLFGNQQIDRLRQIMDKNQVDIIFLPGDIMDDNTLVYDAENMHEHLSRLRAPLGVYATIGNHDVGYHGDSQHHIITHTLEKAGIKVLTNHAIKVKQQFWVVGLPDQLLREGRKPLKEILMNVDTNQAIFVLDHRPDSVLEHAQLPIDLQVSGHVHNGQVFPANLIVRFLNRIHYGHESINQTHFVVTSGYGFWGVPFRLGSQSEVWVIDVVGR